MQVNSQGCLEYSLAFLQMVLNGCLSLVGRFGIPDRLNDKMVRHDACLIISMNVLFVTVQNRCYNGKFQEYKDLLK